MNVKDLLTKYSHEVFKVVKECPGTKFVTMDSDGFLCCWADCDVQYDDRSFEWGINEVIDCGGGWIFKGNEANYSMFIDDLKTVKDVNAAIIKVEDLEE